MGASGKAAGFESVCLCSRRFESQLRKSEVSPLSSISWPAEIQKRVRMSPWPSRVLLYKIPLRVYTVSSVQDSLTIGVGIISNSIPPMAPFHFSFQNPLRPYVNH